MSDATTPPVRWEPVALEAARESWDRDLLTFDDYTLDQSFAWGEFKRRCGWLVHRLVARDAAGRIRAMAQGLVRRYALGFGLAWFPGGPIGEIGTWGDDLRRAMMSAAGVSALYCRVFPHRPATVIDQATLATCGWTPSGARLRSGLSMTLRLDRPLEEIRRGLSGNWRHNLKRAEARDGRIRTWTDPDPAALLAVFRSMETHKGIRPQFTARELEALFAELRAGLLLYRCDGADGEAVALRGCAIVGEGAWDLLAATSEVGRRSYASYALAWRILEECRSRGVREYDLRGIDPEANPGPYNFKKGTGATPVTYLGEWEWATYRPLRWTTWLRTAAPGVMGGLSSWWSSSLLPLFRDLVE